MTLWALMSKNPLPLHNSIQKNQNQNQKQPSKQKGEAPTLILFTSTTSGGDGSVCTCAKANRNAVEIFRIRWSDTTDRAGIASYRF